MYVPLCVGSSAAVMCSVDVILPSVNENIPALGTEAVICSVELVFVNVVEPPAKDQLMSEGRGLALAMQEMLTSSPSTTVTVVVLRASTLRDTGGISVYTARVAYTKSPPGGVTVNS